jgi:integrative and conjugative element protein (TIGR02256 family)
MTDGQAEALAQLRQVEAHAGGRLVIGEVITPTEIGGGLSVTISIDCEEFGRSADGLPLLEREEFVVRIPSTFPFELPSVNVRHARFVSFPHVQWMHHLCLYQAPATEWNPSDGMFGFLDRLHYWLRQGALNQLDPTGAPLHPPVAYTAVSKTVIPHVDVPAFEGKVWLGCAHLDVRSAHRVDVTGWSPFLESDTPPSVAAAILVAAPFPFEFPTRVSDLINLLVAAGVERDRLITCLQWAVLHNEEDAPLYVLIGTPMRGIRGGALKQHLAAWYISDVIAKGLRLALRKYSNHPELREIGEQVEGIILEWAAQAAAGWCVVREDRPEIVTRRDERSAVSSFSGRTVAVWGCGALGGHVAEYLTRAGAGKLLLYDKAVVSPGLLVRQPFDDADVGNSKVRALAARLLRIRPSLTIECFPQDIIDGVLSSTDWTAGADVVIDATASNTTAIFFERQRRLGTRSIPVISMIVGHEAREGLVVVAGRGHTGGVLDVTRRVKLECTRDPTLERIANEFWPRERRQVFQPEPGCSDATFRGSAADVASLAGQMLNRAARALATMEGRTVTAVAHVVGGFEGLPKTEFSWSADFVYSSDSFEIRVERQAWDDLQRIVTLSRRQLGRHVETGGLLFGERDDAARVIWVTEVSGPPADSRASEKGFVCGTLGTSALHEEKRRRSWGSVQYVGMWHTHPDSLPVPSATDYGGMRRLTASTGNTGKVLLVIVGVFGDVSLSAAYVFKAADLRQNRRLGRSGAIQELNSANNESSSTERP